MSDDAAPAVAELQRHVDRFNEGVRTGDFSAMAAAMQADAEVRFLGIPVGPFRAIVAAYREQPPDDEILLLEASGDATSAGGEYAWARDEHRQPAGRITVSVAPDGAIAIVEIDYYTGRDRPSVTR
jgi:steroid Delta-isomerase